MIELQKGSFMKKSIFALVSLFLTSSFALPVVGGRTLFKKMEAVCYFKKSNGLVLEVAGYSPTVKGEVTQAVVSIFSANPTTGAKISLLKRYSMKSDTPANGLSLVFRFSNQNQKVSLELIEADDNSGMSTLTENGKRQALNCDIENEF